MSTVSTGKGSYRARLNRMVHAAAYVGCETFPRGQEYFASLAPGKKSQNRVTLNKEDFAELWNDEADMRFAWFAGALLVIVYASLEIGLQMWLLGLSW